MQLDVVVHKVHGVQPRPDQPAQQLVRHIPARCHVAIMQELPLAFSRMAHLDDVLATSQEAAVDNLCSWVERMAARRYAVSVVSDYLMNSTSVNGPVKGP